jgi:hypothetical protein
MELWNHVFYKKDIENVCINKTFEEIKSIIDNKEKSYCFNNYDNTDYSNGKTDKWTVFINEYNFYDKIIHSYKLYFNKEICIKVEKRY